MANTYTWKIKQIFVKDIDTLNNVAVQACFSVSGIDENGKQGFAESDVALGAPNSENFIEIGNVSEEQVVRWVKSALGDNGAEYEGLVAEQIFRQQTAQPVIYKASWMEDESA